MIKRNMLGLLVLLSASFGAAANQGGGVVNFKGTVIDAPCGIAPESIDQTVDFGQISKSHLTSGGTSVQRNLDIKLVNCDVSNMGTVAVSFTGGTSNAGDELLTSGPTNTAVVLNGYGKNVAFDGTPTDDITLSAGDSTLRFVAWAKMANGAQAVSEGEFTAISNFTMAYQ